MKPEGKLLITLALTLVLLEVGARLGESYLSADVRQMLAQNDIPERIRQVRHEGGASILVIGNSLARASIIPGRIAEAVRSQNGGLAEVFYITPDASGINEWAAAYRKAFPESPQTVRPDFVLIVTGPGHLADHPAGSPEKLSAYHVARAERWKVMKWFPDFSKRFRFMLAGVSRLFANRERVRPLVFYRFVPGFERTAQRLNQSMNDVDMPQIDRGYTADRLGFLLDSLNVPSDRVLIASVPLPSRYELPAVVLEAAKSRDIQVYTKGGGAAWPVDAFPDGYHISPQFGENFTAMVVEEIKRN